MHTSMHRKASDLRICVPTRASTVMHSASSTARRRRPVAIALLSQGPENRPLVWRRDRSLARS